MNIPTQAECKASKTQTPVARDADPLKMHSDAGAKGWQLGEGCPDYKWAVGWYFRGERRAVARRGPGRYSPKSSTPTSARSAATCLV